MVTYTPGNSLPYPVVGDSVKVASRDFRDLAVATDAAITAVTQASKWSKGDLSSSADLDTLVTPGTYGVVSLAITGRPPVEAYGEVTVTRAGVAVMQSYRTSQNPPQLWGRRGTDPGTGWGAWTRTDGAGQTALSAIVEQDRAIQDRRTSETTIAALNATIPEPGKPHAELSFHWDEPTGTYYEKIRVNGVHGGILTKHYGEADQPAPASVVRVPPLTMRQYHDLYGGTVLFNDAGFTDTYAIRGLQISQGVLIREFETGGRGSHAIGFRADGSYGMYSHVDGDTGASVLADGVTETFGFGPFLVRGGVPQYHSGDPLYDFMDIDSGRQILGVNADGEIVLATVHGKSSRYGVSLDDSADVAIRAGMVDAIMLDGGGSAQTMVRGIPLHASSDQPTDRGVPIVGRLDVAVGEQGATAWDDLTGKPATYPPAPHAHQIGDVDGLGARLAIVGAGRPDIPGTMIGSVASAVAAAPSGTEFVSTDGPQGAWKWQKRGTTWTVTDGTITPRDIPFIDGTILTTRPGISTTISRTGDRVTLSIVNVLAVSSGPFSQAQQPIPAGFKPAQEFNGLLTRGSAEQHARLLVQTSGNVIVASASAINGACAATATWVTTDPWPTTLPA